LLGSEFVEAKVKDFDHYLKQEGLSFTFEKRIIFEKVFNLKHHFKAKDIISSIEESAYHISSATVYRTLKMMEKAGVLRRVYENKGYFLYELVSNGTHEGHIICRNCGKMIEVNDVRLEKIEREICKRHKFSAENINVTITGICSTCINKKRGE
jgi:Fur family ferric uptake transcriptional regulator